MKKFHFILIALLMVSGAAAQWVPQISGTTNNLHSVYFTDANTGYAVGDSGTILKTTNGGLNWTAQTTGTNQNLRSVFFTDSEIGYVAGDDSLMLKTTNGGTDWTSHSTGITGWLNCVFFIDSDTGYALGYNGLGSDSRCVIIKTTNGGSLWSIIYTASSHREYLYSIFFPEPNTGYVVGVESWIEQYGRIYKTINAGNDWTLIYDDPFNTNDRYYSVYFINSDTGIAVGYDWTDWENGGKILRTNNGGAEWTSQYMPCNTLFSVSFTDPNTGYVIGQKYNDYIYRTTDGGNAWISQPLGLTEQSNCVYFPCPDTGYIVGDSGIILNTTNGGLPVGIKDKPLTAESLKIHPNPASNNIAISTPTTPNKNTFLTLYSAEGKQLIERQITEQQTLLDVSGLSQGIYLVRVTDDRMSIVGKFIKQ